MNVGIGKRVKEGVLRIFRCEGQRSAWEQVSKAEKTSKRVQVAQRTSENYV